MSVESILLRKRVELLQKFNPNHAPAGSPRDGEFTSGSGGGKIGASGGVGDSIVAPQSGVFGNQIASKVSQLYVDPDDKAAFSKAKKELKKAYENDEDVRRVADVGSAFTQGSFKEIRNVAEQQENGTYAKTVAENRAERISPENQNSPYGKVDGTNFGQPMGTIKTVGGKELNSMDHTEANKAAAQFQDSIAHAPQYNKPVFRGMSWNYTEENAKLAWNGGTYDAPTWGGNKTPTHDQFLTTNKYGEEVLRPKWEAVSKYAAPKFTVGQEINQVGPTSFTRNKETAVNFSEGTDKGQRIGKEGNNHGVRVVMELEAGAKGLHADLISPWKQAEFITNGKLVVTSVETTMVEKRSQYGAVKKVEVHHVKLKQVSTFGGKPADIPPPPSQLERTGIRYRKEND